MANLGEKMRAARDQRGLTLKQVAAAMGVHFTTVQKYEAGDRPVTEDALRSWSDAVTLLTPDAPVFATMVVSGSELGAGLYTPEQSALVAETMAVAARLNADQVQAVRAMLRALDPQPKG